MVLDGLDLFSGIGGISYALRQWIKPVAYCELEPYCQAVLLSRMADGLLASAPIWDDIRTLEARCLPRAIDIVYGGFPCQDISVAGHGKGLEGKRSGLFFDIVRLCSEIKPRFIFLENVPAVTTRGGIEVVRTITAMGYDCRWCIISAASVGALHRRERWFLLAHANHNGSPTNQKGRRVRKESPEGKQCEPAQMFEQVKRAGGLSGDVADSERERLEGWKNAGESQIPELRDYCPTRDAGAWREIVSSMGKCTNGISDHVDRLKSLGNSVVPQQVKEAFQILTGIKKG